MQLQRGAKGWVALPPALEGVAYERGNGRIDVANVASRCNYIVGPRAGWRCRRPSKALPMKEAMTEVTPQTSHHDATTSWDQEQGGAAAGS